MQLYKIILCVALVFAFASTTDGKVYWDYQGAPLSEIPLTSLLIPCPGKTDAKCLEYCDRYDGLDDTEKCIGVYYEANGFLKLVTAATDPNEKKIFLKRDEEAEARGCVYYIRKHLAHEY